MTSMPVVQVRIHPTQEFRVQGLSPHYNIRPTMKWRSWTKTRSIDAKANEKKDSETNLRASVTHSNRKRNEVGSSTTSVAKEAGVTFLRSWDTPMLLFQRVTYLDESPSPCDRWRGWWTARIYQEQCSRQRGNGYRGLQAETDLNS